MTRRIASFLLLAALFAGCGYQSGTKSGSEPAAARPGTDAVTADAPQLVTLTDQTKVWECPKCGMDFDRAGQCNMCHVDLVETDVAYICPADNKPVERAGDCPRCNVDAKVVKTAVVAAAPVAQ